MKRNKTCRNCDATGKKTKTYGNVYWMEILMAYHLFIVSFIREAKMLFYKSIEVTFR
jgi:hypothetical protein